MKHLKKENRMKKTILALACLTLLEGSAYSVVFENNTKGDKTALILFKNGEKFEANVGGTPVDTKTNMIGDKEAKKENKIVSIKWFGKNGGRVLANCKLHGITHLSQIGAISLNGKMKYNCQVVPLVKK